MLAVTIAVLACLPTLSLASLMLGCEDDSKHNMLAATFAVWHLAGAAFLIWHAGSK